MQNVANIFGIGVGAALVAYGFWYFFQPQGALAAADHTVDRLPLVMGGRYMFFGALLISALLYGDHSVTTALLVGFTFLAVVDTVIYWNIAPARHAITGVVCALFALFFFRQRKVGT